MLLAITYIERAGLSTWGPGRTDQATASRKRNDEEKVEVDRILTEETSQNVFKRTICAEKGILFQRAHGVAKPKIITHCTFRRISI